MSGLGSAKDPENSSHHLSRLLEGLPVTDRRLDLAGTSTPVLEGGDGPPVVLLHGVGGFAEEWVRVLPRLVGSHRVVVPDLPGLGRSQAGAGRLDAASVVDWLRHVIDETCSEPPTLVGHSLGGSIAARFAIEHGERISRVILVDSGSIGRFRPAPGVIWAILRFGARPNPTNHDRFLRQVLVNPERVAAEWGDRWSALEGYDIELAGNKKVSTATGQLVRRIAARRIPQEQLAGITIPVALIWGRGDRLMHFRIAEKAAARFGWPLHSIDDCGHGPHIERPDAFLEAVGAAMDARPS
jgi:pimeloyl-ACP methyl ester carboxylesterase